MTTERASSTSEIANPKPPCDFCGEETAVIYCRADTARLCLFCDHDVHSANALSKKHGRGQICDKCTSEVASVLCCADGVVLCHNCNSQASTTAFSGSVSHSRSPIELFYGCPDAAKIASLWGIDLDEAYSGGNDLMMKDLYVPCAVNGRGMKLVLLQQLMELARREGEKGYGCDVGAEEVEAEDCGGDQGLRDCASVDLEAKSSKTGNNMIDEQGYLDSIPFTSLLTMPSYAKCGEERDQIVEEDSGFFWDCAPASQPSQVCPVISQHCSFISRDFLTFLKINFLNIAYE